MLPHHPQQHQPPADAAACETPVGFYHHVIGLDVASPAPIATYIANIAAAQPAAGWLTAGTWRVTAAVYCCWDAFEREDLRVRITIPGGVAVSVVRCGRDGAWVEGSEPSDAEWQRFSLSALLRALCPPPKMPCLRLLPPPLSPEEESGFLHAARAQLLYTPGSCTPHQECVPTEETLDDVTDVPFSTEKDMLAQLFYTFFAQAHRFEQALAFFAPLAANCVYVASMQQHPSVSLVSFGRS